MAIFGNFGFGVGLYDDGDVVWMIDYCLAVEFSSNLKRIITKISLDHRYYYYLYENYKLLENELMYKVKVIDIC